MIISHKNKYIFIEVPKTGTTSIRKFLIDNDPSATRNEAEINGIYYKFKLHMKAHEAQQVLGLELYKEFRVFAFVRDPYEKLVSRYFYFNQMTSKKKRTKKQTIGTTIKSITASIFPLQLWTLLFPYDGNIRYLTDKKGNIIVDHIGSFENINEDLKSILRLLNLDMDTTKLSERNRSSYNKSKRYFSNTLFKRLMHLKMGEDLKFYNKEKLDSKNKHN
jgi:hypothetical protein